MKHYKVIGIAVTLRDGIVEINEAQAKRRRHAIRPLPGKDGFYELTGPTSFKRGEELGYSGQVNRVLLQDMEEVSPLVPAASDEKPEVTLEAMGPDELEAALDSMTAKELKAAIEARGYQVAWRAKKPALVEALKEVIEEIKAGDGD